LQLSNFDFRISIFEFRLKYSVAICKNEETQVTIRKAMLNDVPEIHRLISHYARKSILLPRTLIDLYENVWEFMVAEDEGRVVGCGALKLYSQELAEIRSLCVDKTLKSQGIGAGLVEGLLDHAEALGLKTVFALTISTPFFEKMGFHEAHRLRFPTKVWRDCLRCERYNCCDETALSIELADRHVPAGEPATEAAEVSG
jgi:amino-acid N-acetyltransferase